MFNIFNRTMKYCFIFLLILISYIVKSFAIVDKIYESDDIGKIIIIIIVILIILSPQKWRIIILGTLLGLVFVYGAYKIILPFIY